MTTNIQELIDHTLLKPQATVEEIQRLCTEAAENKLFSVCVHPYWITDCRQFLEGTSVKVCTVIGFPLGANQSKTKAFETRTAIETGADEIDMVMNIAAAKEGHFDFLEKEIHEVVTAAQKRPVKVILETCYLTDEEIRQSCQRAVRAQASFVKTSTGFGTAGATVAHVKLMRETVGCCFGVKASGGIRDRAAAESMLEAGANRLGLSASLAIIGQSTAERSSGY